VPQPWAERKDSERRLPPASTLQPFNAPSLNYSLPPRLPTPCFHRQQPKTRVLKSRRCSPESGRCRARSARRILKSRHRGRNSVRCVRKSVLRSPRSTPCSPRPGHCRRESARRVRKSRRRSDKSGGCSHESGHQEPDSPRHQFKLRCEARQSNSRCRSPCGCACVKRTCPLKDL
jgi:hypothetical protein